ncbi:HAD family hydrolase [Halobaculum gomorrense]|uniref:Putative hydrolase of the HAD superfamily n=1 Tax=Halobaculum gomorrense TaxID=43928 RepID=A0A1M5T3R7_9EURY|nr:HAD family hydrolase [Halobaculum gomorrense]SHH45409.1 putative hydrolase of the HAD superfamily [Halobaculum gomorrense]
MPTAIWFDLDGTLLPFPEYDSVISRACETAGVDAVDAFTAEYNDAFFERLDALDPEPYRRAAATALASIDADTTPDTFVTALRAAEYDAMPAPDAVRETLAELSDTAGYRVGVCTNGVGDWQREKLEHAGLADLIDATVVSYEAGAHKPDPAPFERAESALSGDRRVMIGDSEDADVAGARDCGWEAVHVTGPAAVPDAVASVR